MGEGNFSDEFKRDAVAQITGRGCQVAEVSQRLGVREAASVRGGVFRHARHRICLPSAPTVTD